MYTLLPTTHTAGFVSNRCTWWRILFTIRARTMHTRDLLLRRTVRSCCPSIYALLQSVRDIYPTINEQLHQRVRLISFGSHMTWSFANVLYHNDPSTRFICTSVYWKRSLIIFWKLHVIIRWAMRTGPRTSRNEKKVREGNRCLLRGRIGASKLPIIMRSYFIVPFTRNLGLNEIRTHFAR